jgi:hypothetical protein
VDDRVPLAFEKRIMARIAGSQPLDFWALLGKPLWVSASVCLAVSILLSVWSMAAPGDVRSVSLETALLSMAEELSESW